MKINKTTLRISLGALLIISVFGAHAQEAKTAADYEQATKFLWFNTNSKVHYDGVRPVWREDGTFWYNVSTPGGDQFVLVNPAKKSKKTASSRAELLGEENNGAQNTTPPINRNEIPSPDGKKVVFIRDWNLWMRNLETNKETQLTTDGTENFGYATDNAGWRKSDRPVVLWSPDSKKLVTFQQDQRHVSDMYLVSTKVGEPELQAWKYPIPQDEDIIRIHRVIINVDEPKVIRLKMEPDARRGTLCDDIACTGAFDDNEWSADGSKLVFVSTSRDHKEAKVRMADATTGEVRDIFEEVVDTQYESGQGTVNWHYLDATNEIIWYSERSDWGHLYLYDATTGALKNQITSGDFVVTELIRVDEKNRMLYFYAQGREEGRDPYFAHFYSIDFNGKKLSLLTPDNGHHSVSISGDGKFFVDTYSQPDVPPVSVLRNSKGKEIMVLEKADISALAATGWKAPTPVKVKSRDGRWDLYGLMFTPTTLDESKKYPVVNYIYPGPQGGGVGRRSFSASRSDHQALAELGFVVIVIDGTCNPGRSKSFHDVCYGNMADNTLEDQISGIKQLAERHPYIDTDRVGIWGHSGGGFATAAAMFRYPEFYKVGISESGNHDNRNYEDDWGERYIGLIQGDNYEEQANQNYAKNLQGKLMLAHGGLDDNVPPYNTYLVVDALVKANKDFDLIIFPNARHGFGADSYYMMRRRWDYFVEHLQGVEPPKEFKISQ
ncbi:S9 family peptidase [Fulvivirga sedimenti]|uniref:DPP IV N-terminal domain-containing protein n=1 Tax=Fulvivirga sedimenti TaxID=2879465 RepID=A0A9X1HNR4_9BACT|nr:DPP IV N-terminal domain-containing protein [Fulvivirga sedimenti]MCA6075564.1 DPP IV N-terminal domain-containing protein [Fulvivirga sedimenti]MCA6076741.1 DPP IV N-terminal domain-containing protein [Fulvivirga sedimenti]MCA6077869.1 DPP IV N-terminal domain-containing protein [Fulvivirga sedimenti]